MKLSEILGWKVKSPVIKDQGANNALKDKAYCRGHKTAIDACDLEIDREALMHQLKIMSQIDNLEQKFNFLISGMPTWLRK